MIDPDPYDDLTGLEEHEDFERGAEDQELRAYREEAARELQLEAYWHYCECQEESGAKPLSFRDWITAAESPREYQELPPPPDDEDIPF